MSKRFTANAGTPDVTQLKDILVRT